MLKRTTSLITVAAVGLTPLLSMNLAHGQYQAPDNDYWWPNRLSLEPLR